MLMGTLAALGIIALGYFSNGFAAAVERELELIDFSEFLLGILLSFLPFLDHCASTLLIRQSLQKSMASFAVIGTVLPTFIVGYGCNYLTFLFQMPAPIIFLLLALISPTDPIAVMGILKEANLSKTIETI